MNDDRCLYPAREYLTPVSFFQTVDAAQAAATRVPHYFPV